MRSKLAAAGAAVLLVAGIAVWALPQSQRGDARPALGLFTSLPIYWAESDSIAETLDSRVAHHWARIALESDYRLAPLDTLDESELKGFDRLVMAQPRPLAPAENVALDEWVRSGGRVLLFADPMLTEHSRFMLGDKRRPQDVVVLSPILGRWGLGLEYDEDQPDTERTVRFNGDALPVHLAGRFRAIAPGAPAACEILEDSVVARCTIGRGRALIVADAAVLETARDPRVAGKQFAQLVDAAFGS